MFSEHPTVRIVIYALSVAAQIASVFIALTKPELAAAFVTVAGILSTLAGGTALSNIHAKSVNTGDHVRANGLDG